MSVELGLFCGRERGADILPKSGGGAGQAKRTLGVGLNGSGASETFEEARDSAFVFEFLKNFQTFAVEGVGRGAIALFSCEVSEIGEGAGDAPAIAEFAKHGEGLLVEGASGCGVAFIAGDVTFVIDRPGYSGAIAQLVEERLAFVVESAGSREVTLEFNDACEIA